jgi:hypothetical protein
MSVHVLQFLEALAPHYAKRHDNDEAMKEWAKGWIRSLKSYDPWLLERAAMRIIDTRDERSHPLIPDVKKVCSEIIREERASKPGLKVDHTEQLSDPYSLADALIRCDLGRQAAKAEPCWILALHDFCRTNRRLPTGHEINRCKQVAIDFEQRYRDCVTGNAGAFSKPLLAWAETIIRKREDLRARLVGREAA